MPTDHPDGLQPIDFSGATIKVPVDIQAQYVTLEMDIVAQTVGNITIDIAAQSVGSLDINLAASAITLDINLLTSAITLDINIKTSDITLNVNLAASDIILNINIASAVTLDINLQAQSITLDIDIVAQTVGNIAINLAASAITLNVNILTSSITLNVDIAAQTVGDITISIDAQSVGVYLQPEWTALQGTDKNLAGQTSVPTGSTTTVLSYLVTAGKTLYITNLSGQGANVQGAFSLFFYTPAFGTFIRAGGYSGCFVPLPKPIAIPGNTTLEVKVLHWAGTDKVCGAALQGYEI